MASGAVVVTGVAATFGLGPAIHAQVGSRQTVFRLSTRNTRTCNACRQHARHKIFETFFIADSNRAHPGCNCPIIVQQTESSLVEQLKGLETRGIGVWDIRALPRATSQNTRQLVAGWNLIGVPGDAQFGDLITALDGRFDAIFAWDATNQGFLSFHVGVPDQANTLRELRREQAIWILISHPDGALLSLPQESPASRARSVSLSEGWNLVPWLGEDRHLAPEASISLGEAMDVLHRWDASTQQFVSYFPRFPVVTDEPVELRTDEGVWLRVNRAIDWSQRLA